MHSQQRKRSSLKHPFSLILILLCLCDWPGMPLLMVLVRCSLIFTMMALRGQLHMHASRTLTPSEQNYTQLEKEALSLVFGIKKFHPYIYGREFPITSHSPPFWDPRQVSLPWLQLDCRGGHCCYHHTSTKFSTRPPRHTAMLMGYIQTTSQNRPIIRL